MPDLIEKGFIIDDFANMRFNLTNLRFENLNYDNTYPLVELLEDRIVYKFRNFNLGIGWDYSYITQPPVFADIGRFDLDI